MRGKLVLKVQRNSYGLCLSKNLGISQTKVGHEEQFFQSWLILFEKSRFSLFEEIGKLNKFSNFSIEIQFFHEKREIYRKST